MRQSRSSRITRPAHHGNYILYSLALILALGLVLKLVISGVSDWDNFPFYSMGVSADGRPKDSAATGLSEGIGVIQIVHIREEVQARAVGEDAFKFFPGNAPRWLWKVVKMDTTRQSHIGRVLRSVGERVAREVATHNHRMSNKSPVDYSRVRIPVVNAYQLHHDRLAGLNWFHQPDKLDSHPRTMRCVEFISSELQLITAEFPHLVRGTPQRPSEGGYRDSCASSDGNGNIVKKLSSLEDEDFHYMVRGALFLVFVLVVLAYLACMRD